VFMNLYTVKTCKQIRNNDTNVAFVYNIMFILVYTYSKLGLFLSYNTTSITQFSEMLYRYSYIVLLYINLILRPPSPLNISLFSGILSAVK